MSGANRFYSSTATATTLSGSIGFADTTINVGASTGFPTSFPYTLALEPDTAAMELVEVTSANGNSLLVTRGVDGTAALDHTAGAVVQHVVSGRDFREPQEHMGKATNVHGLAVGSAVV